MSVYSAMILRAPSKPYAGRCLSLPTQTVALRNAGLVKGYNMQKSPVHEQTNRHKSKAA